jgi:hypothetical protein
MGFLSDGEVESRTTALFRLALICALLVTGLGMAEGDTPEDLMFNASLAHAAGRDVEARQLLERAIGESSAATSTIMARGQLIDLLLAQDPIDFEAVATELNALSGTMTDQRRLSEIHWRVIFHRFRSASPEERLSLREQLHKLPTPLEFAPSAVTWTSLDSLLVALADTDQIEQADDLLIHLLVRAPDATVSRALNERRMHLLVDETNWELARYAADLGVLLAATSSEGTLPLVNYSIFVREKLVLSEDDLKSFRTALENDPFWENDPYQAVLPPVFMVGTKIGTAAQELIASRGSELSHRHLTWVYALMGDADEAFNHGWAHIESSPFDSPRLLQAFDDLCTATALVDGHFANATRLLHHLSSADSLPRENAEEPPADSAPQTFAELPSFRRSHLIEVAAVRADRRMLAWVSHSEQWSQAVAAMVVDAQRDPEDSREIITQLRMKLERDVGASGTAQWMGGFTDFVQRPSDKRFAALAAAEAFFNDSQFARCLELLNRADELFSPATGDINAGISRAICLSKMNDLPGARSHLRDMRAWPAGNEEKACVDFLLGWICLKEQNKDEGLGWLRLVVDHFPETSYSLKACQLIAALER